MESFDSKPFHFPEVRVVEASAGSGKTFALAKRYIQLLLNPDLPTAQIPIRNILALTFTNRAAFEMKGRILEFLKAIALDRLSKAQEEELLTSIGIPKEKARGRAFMIMDDLIRHFNFFQVQTIDKFVNALLSGCAFKIGLTSNFKIKTNSKDYLEHSLDQLLDQAGEDPAVNRIFENFLHNYLYLENRTGWFPKQDMLGIVQQLFMQDNFYGLGFRTSKFKPEGTVKLKTRILSKIKDLRPLLPEKADRRFLRALDKFLEQNTAGFDIDSVSDYFARDQLPVTKGAKLSPEADRIWRSIRNDLDKVCRQEAHSLFDPYLRVYQNVHAGLLALSAKDDVLFLEELNKKAEMLFDSEHITVEELYYRLATRFEHYLIDEFQDTNRLQWRNLEQMVEEALSTGGSLFYVGDRKQAIYGFRGGEVELFDAIKDKFNHFNVKTDQLTNNWRSEKAVVEFNNAVFSPENLRSFIKRREEYENDKRKKNRVRFHDEDLEELEHMFKTAKQTFQPDHAHGYVRVEHIIGTKKDDRDHTVRQKLLQGIHELKQRFDYRDIAILTRSNKEVETMTYWLLEEGVPVESERTSDVRESVLIKELVSLLRFLSSPIDNDAFASFILGDLFLKASGLTYEEMEGFIFSLRTRLAQQKETYLYTEFRQRYERVWMKYFDEFFKNVGLYPMYEFVVSIYSRFGCLDRFPDQQGYFMHFLELIKKYEADYADIDSFLDHFEQIEGDDLYVHVTDSDAIKLLTIHKSKGLEFPVVIIPNLGMEVQVASGKDQHQSYILRQSDGFIELLRLKNKYLNFSNELYRIYASEYKKSLISELNSIYVAMTRAQKELYVFIPERIGKSFNFAKFLVPESLYEQGSKVTYRTVKKRGSGILNLSRPRYYDWIEYLKDEFKDEQELQHRSRRLRGEMLHYALSFVKSTHDRNSDEVATAACNEARLKYPNVSYWADLRSQIKTLIEDERLRKFFDVSTGEVMTEKEVVTPRGHTKRMDRLVVSEKDAWIIDFKSSRDPHQRYQSQMREYIKIMTGMYPDRDVKGAVVFLDQLDLEIISSSTISQQTSEAA